MSFLALLCRWRFFCVRDKLLPIMRTTFQLSFALMALAVSAATLPAQEKIAEGRYQLGQPGSSRSVKTLSHWVLTSQPGAGYVLRSEISNSQGQIRVIQIEELDSQLVPASIGYELYTKERQTPDASLTCKFSGTSITCDGTSEKGRARASQPCPHQEAFMLVVEELSRFDFGWLAAGTLNMAHLDTGKTKVHTIHVGGGAALELTDDINVATLQAAMTPNQKFTAVRPKDYTEWEFTANDGEEEILAFVGNEVVTLGRDEISARHYSLSGGDTVMDFWVAGPGLLVKTSVGNQTNILLTDYRQFKPLISGIKVEEPQSGATEKPK